MIPASVVLQAGEHGHAEIGTAGTGFFALLLVGLILCLAFEEKLHAKKSVIAGFFAMLSLFCAGLFHLIPQEAVTLAGHELHIPNFLAHLDLNVISIILGSAIFIDVISQSGIFTWIAIRLTKASGGDPRKLFQYYGVMTVVFSALLNNVTAILIVGSLTSVSLSKLQRRDLLLGFLLIQGLLTNIGGLLTLVSSVPNIIIGQTAGLGYVQFLLIAAPYVVLATAGTLWIGARRFQVKGLATAAEREAAAETVAGFDENETIESKGFFQFSAILGFAFILAMATADLFEVTRSLTLGFVASAFAVLGLLKFRHDVDRFYKGVDWDLILFFVGLFMMIGVMDSAGVLGWIGSGIASIVGATGSGGLLASSAIFSSVTDNIPLAAMLANILNGSELATATNWWAVVFGANLGGNFTPIGSASTLVAVTVIHQQGLKLGFLQFVLTALPLAIFHVVLGILYVLFVLPWHPAA